MKYRIWSLLVALGLLLAGREAAAETVQVPYMVAHLAAKSIPLPPNVWTTPPTGNVTATPIEGCEVWLTAKTITPKDSDPAKCKALWQSKFPVALTIDAKKLEKSTTATLAKDPVLPALKEPQPGDLGKSPMLKRVKEQIECTVCKAEKFADYHMYFWVPESEGHHWEKRAAQQDKDGKGVFFDVVGPLASTSEPLDVTVNFDEKGIVQDSEKQFQVPSEASDIRKVPPCPDPAEKLDEFCDPMRTPARGYLLCVDLAKGADAKVTRIYSRNNGDATTATLDDRRTLLPNRDMLLLVRHRANEDITVTRQGDIGLTKSGTDNQAGGGGTASGGDEKPKVEEKVPCPKAVVTERPFAARKPGRSDVEIKLMDHGTTTAKLVYPVELIVEETYVGAIRLGVAALFNDAVDRSYEARTYPGSKQAEIGATTFGHVNAEIVLGFAPYLFDYLKTGEGRPAITKGTGLAPYFGIGLLNANGTGIELVKSIHLGLEYQFAPSFSLALTGVGRRVNRLPPGFTVGSPVTGTVPTTTGFGLGVGLVLNFSPEFFKISAQSATSIFN